MGIISEIRQNIRLSGKVTYQFIAVNVVVFLCFQLLFIFEKLLFRSAYILTFYRDHLALPAALDTLAWHPWTLITYMFLHGGFWHILWNMLVLFWFGRLLEEYVGRKKIVTLYFLGGIVGGLLYIAAYNIFPYLRDFLSDAYMVGASASIMAILVACATLLPDHTFFLLFLGPVRLKYIAVFLVVINLLSIVGSNPGGMIAHLGGAGFGYFFIRQLRRGNDMSETVYGLAGKLGGLFKRRSKLKVKYVNKKQSRSARSSQTEQDEVDAILDKISQSGYESLTKEEKERLFRASKK